MIFCQSGRVYKKNIWVPQTLESDLQLCRPRPLTLSYLFKDDQSFDVRGTHFEIKPTRDNYAHLIMSKAKYNFKSYQSSSFQLSSMFFSIEYYAERQIIIRRLTNDHGIRAKGFNKSVSSIEIYLPSRLECKWSGHNTSPRSMRNTLTKILFFSPSLFWALFGH